MNLDELRSAVSGTVLTPADDGFADELTGVDPSVVHTPEIVVGAASEEDVSAAVRYAAEHGLRVSVLSTGHGIHEPVREGLTVTTRRLDHVTVDADAATATIGAGATWHAVLPATAVHGLTAITGSAPGVGVVGYLLGGGCGPLARSHGFSSDHVVAVRLVRSDGSVVTASASENPDLLWALRGGKGGFGVVTSVTLSLLPLTSIYGGSLLFESGDIETVLRGWIEWTATAPDEVTTSIQLAHYPPFDEVPPPLRGRYLAALRFCYPGDGAEGERLAAPLRALAPVYLDGLGELPTTEIGRVHNDPEGGGPSMVRGTFLDALDQDLATELLEHLGADVVTPLTAVEVRQLGSAAAIDVPEGSAVGGRPAAGTLLAIGADPSTFAETLPAELASLFSSVDPWIAAESNINWSGEAHTVDEFRRNWPADTFDRLESLRAQYDPTGVFAYGPGDR